MFTEQEDESAKDFSPEKEKNPEHQEEYQDSYIMTIKERESV